jgi:hypothetical protein
MEATVRPYTQQPGWDTGNEQPTLSPEEELARQEEIQAAVQRRQENNTPQWLTIIDDLAQGDRTKWDYFFNMPIIEFLNTYSFRMARKRELANELEQAANQGAHSAIVRALNQILFTR